MSLLAHAISRLILDTPMPLEDAHQTHMPRGDRQILEAVMQIATGAERREYLRLRHAELLEAAAKEDPMSDPPGPQPVTTLAEVAARYGDITWDWRNRLPCGVSTMIAGPSGVGKSTLALALAGTYILGWPWPDGTEHDMPGRCVLWVECEGAQGLLVRRATDMGLPLDRLLLPFDGERTPRLDDAEDQAEIERIASRADVGMVVIDSLRGAIGAGADENASTTFHAVKWCSDLARHIARPVLILHHVNKDTVRYGAEPTLGWIRGSGAIVQPLRMVYIVHAPDPMLPARSIAQVKNSMGELAEPIGFRIVAEGIEVCASPRAPRRDETLAAAEALILETLATGRRPWTHIEEAAKQHGLAERTLRRARSRLQDRAKIKIWTEGRAYVWGLLEARS